MRASSPKLSRTRLHGRLLLRYSSAQFVQPCGRVRYASAHSPLLPHRYSSSQVATHTRGAFQLIATSFSE